MRLRKLQQIAGLIRDRDLAVLGLASARKTRTESLLGALDTARGTPDLDPVIANQIENRFGLWTTNRRISLNQQLARDTVQWMAARTDAQMSFGRAEVLKKLEAELVRLPKSSA